MCFREQPSIPLTSQPVGKGRQEGSNIEREPMQLKELIFGTPWIYRRLRPALLGGFDFSRVYNWLECEGSDVIVDIGCGFGSALEHIHQFKEYHGFDTSLRAIEWMKSEYPAPNIHLYPREATALDLQRLLPTKLTLMGLLHHIDDNQAGELLSHLAESKSLRKVITSDTVFVRGRCINNILCRLDRGRWTRSQKGYENLVGKYGLRIEQRFTVETGFRFAQYFCMGLSPSRQLA